MNRRSSVAELIATIKYYHLDEHDDQVADILFMAEQGMLSESMAKAYLFSLQDAIEHAKDFPNFLHRPPTQEQLDARGKPDIEVGTLVEGEQARCGIRLKGRVPHILAAGSTGSGKSTLMRAMIHRIEELNVREETEADQPDCAGPQA
jgi:chromosomal replication initiation ATPase DnaA